MKKWIYIIIGLGIIAAITITFDIIIFNNSNNKKENDIDNNIDSNSFYYYKHTDQNVDKKIINNNIEVIETSNEDEKISPNCIFIFKTYYPKCNHIKVEKCQVDKTMVNKTKEELEALYKDWSVVTFRNDEVLLYKEEEGICNEHYLVKEVDDKVKIYILDENDALKEEERYFEASNIIIEYLTEEDNTKLKEGIIVYGKDELNKLLEDYE